jgi:hypothetical protein
VVEAVSTINNVEVLVVRQFQVVKLDPLVVSDTQMAGVMMCNYDYLVDLFNELLCEFENMDLDSSQKWVAEV